MVQGEPSLTVYRKVNPLRQDREKSSKGDLHKNGFLKITPDPVCDDFVWALDYL